MDCDQTCKDIEFNNHGGWVYNIFGFVDFDPFFKIIWGFILKTILSLEPMDVFFFFKAIKGISV